MDNVATLVNSFDGLYDATPLTAVELCEQCRALVFAMTELANPIAKELLNSILWERIDQLYQTLTALDVDPQAKFSVLM
ncbi:MAG: hypothetical protein L0G81_14190 [Ewingella sp.]|nr:hypothetical protein [Ewingella sp.]